MSKEKSLDPNEDLPDDWSIMSFNEDQWIEFKKSYKRALEKEDRSFKYMGQEFHTGFAGYFIEFHNHKFN